MPVLERNLICASEAACHCFHHTRFEHDIMPTSVHDDDDEDGQDSCSSATLWIHKHSNDVNVPHYPKMMPLSFSDHFKAA